MITQIATNLEDLGVKKGDCLLVHTSFKALGKGVTADEVIKGLLSAVGDDGTLILPALSYSIVTQEAPRFDIKNTPACIGYLPNFFLSYPGIIRSMHPTHSCAALGKNAVEFTQNHYIDRTPVGKNSPFYMLKEYDGKILFLGCTSAPNTSMHGVEELVEPDYLYGDYLEYTLTNYDGKSYNATYRTHGFHRIAQRYGRVEGLLNQYEMSKGRVLQADCTLMSAKAVWQKAKEAMEKKPYCFVEKI
ncbi:MAG: AAC(3) family N-acetyltransferase [Clostridiales bacterium]|jgi:aminoglycoside 3-N-acetyltransferase|nr:AAC(3) family N-acetyltransferase [Clostridiales bacterium]